MNTPDTPSRHVVAACASLAGRIAAAYLLLKATTCRFYTSGLDELDDRLAAGEQVLLVFWHGKYLSLFALLRGRRGCVFTSRSFRGQVIAATSRKFGYECVQLPARGGARSLAMMHAALGAHQTGAIAVDGPLGPYHRVKPGAVRLASMLGLTVIPVAAASRQPRRLLRRWDRMEVPGFFAQLSVVIGQGLRIPPDLERDSLRAWSERVKTAIDEVEKRATDSVRLN